MMQLAVLLAAACGVGVAAGDKAWLEGPAPLPSAFDHLKHRHADRISRKLATCHPDYDLAKIEGLLSSTHESCASTEASVRVGCSTQQRNGATEAYCRVRNLRINPKAALEYALQPGERNRNKAGVQPAELDLSTVGQMGRMPEACKAAPQTGLGGQKFLAQVIAGSPSNGGEGHCTLTVMDPVLFVADKYGEHNPWHSMEDTTHAFTLLSLSRFPHSATRVLLVDRPERGPPPTDYFGMWNFVWEALAGGGPLTSFGRLLLNATELASAVDVEAIKHPELKAALQAPSATSEAAMKQLWEGSGGEMTLCFAKSTYSLHGGVSMLSGVKSVNEGGQGCPSSPIVLGLADMALAHLPGGRKVPPSYTQRGRSDRTLNILFLTRGGTMTVSKNRRVQDPDGLLRELNTIPGARARKESFDDMPKLQQLALIRETDVLVSVHGAGLTWIMFLPEASGVVEMTGMGVGCHCFENLAHWTGHPYDKASVENFGQVTDRVRTMVGAVHDTIDRLQSE